LPQLKFERPDLLKSHLVIPALLLRNVCASAGTTGYFCKKA
jgi:hypothetical protein